MFDKLPPRVLIIESTKSINVSLSNVIERAWFNLVKANTIEKAIASSIANHPDIIIVDSMVQDKVATEIATKLREINGLEKVPIIFLLHSGESPSNYTLEDNNFVVSLTKPFTSDQLMISIRSLLRRSNLILQDKVIKYKEVSMDLTTYKVTNNGRIIRLGPTEFKILQLFIKAPKVIFSRQDIVDKVWGRDTAIDLRTIDVHINRIRTSLKNKESEVFIKTIRAIGYCLDLPNS
ncbi:MULTISPECIES: winged helix-turn-helix domain-containing protein [unclassified Candidatus Tisiphia]|uniref:winged helix-turn-helix domain-containing protein n=1 Tax=unclassified Candidatus Tisiphia TaxID=2996318 RepID=UPI00312C73A1|nr:winged helix-turn-helix domain-containing protein [Rickettsiaceae bacterium]MDD9337526.1 winged helix-turn-helix domain-containing protein [Rickettsiaceae bacterium]